VHQFADNKIKPIALAHDREENFDKRFPWNVLAKAGKLSLRTLALSENNGGGGDALTNGIVAEELAVADVGVAATLNHTSDLGRVISVQTILCLRRSSQPRLNHKRLKSLNLISGQPLRGAGQTHSIISNFSDA
jgi:alkylation response protein AidB-like acyl-CoA dehydrogenase